MNEVISVMNETLQLLKFGSDVGVEMNRITTFFLDKYQSESRIPILEFYESYYKYQTTPGLLDEVNIKQDMFIRKRETLVSKWTELFTESMLAKIREAIASKSEVAIDLQEVRKVVSKLGVNPQIETTSYGAFFQFDNSEETFILNGVFAGFGKMFGRFLPLLDFELTTDLRKHNDTLAIDDVIFAEASDATFFTANVHPYLVPFGIDSPGSNYVVPPTSLLSLKSLYVRYNPSSGQVELRRMSDDKQVLFFDLGFQSPRERSKLYNLLCTFTKIEYLNTGLIIRAVNDVFKKEMGKSDFSIQPRIILNKSIVLQRKSWIVPINTIPRWQGSTMTQSFLNLNAWRRKNSIPADAFVSIGETKSLSGLTPAQKAKIGRDDHKPQYVNFNNPMFVNLFKKILDKTSTVIKLQEMTPGPRGCYRSMVRRKQLNCSFNGPMSKTKSPKTFSHYALDFHSFACQDTF